MTSPARTVEVYTPSQAPHLGPIAAEIETALTRQLESLSTPALRRLLRVGDTICREREEFRRRLGVEGV